MGERQKRRRGREDWRTTLRVVGGGLTAAVVALVALGVVIGIVVSGGVLSHEMRSLSLERARVLQPYRVAGAVLAAILWMIIRGVTVGAFIYVLVGAARSVVRFLRLRAGLVHARRGVFPVIEVEAGYLYDPNRDNRGAHPLITAAALDVQRASALSHAESIKAALRLEGGSTEEIEELPATLWPSLVDLRSLLEGEPSITSLVLGVTMTEDGRWETVVEALSQLVHIAVGGTSGYGKSVFMQALAWQLANSAEDLDLVAVDLEGVTLNVLAQSKRLLYPLADNEAAAVAVLHGLTEELERRKSLYSEAGPGVASLSAYNAQVDSDRGLKPIVLLIDEATALLDDKRVEGALRTVTLRARKFGVWAVLAGQDWKAASLDTAIRNQLSTRIQFRAMSASQSRVLLGTGDAADLRAKGRAIAELPGRGRLMIQAPMVIPAMFADVTGGPRRDLPALAQAPATGKGLMVDDPDLSDEERVRLLRQQGVSLNEIQRRVFGGVGGNYYYRVRDILEGNDGGQ